MNPEKSTPSTNHFHGTEHIPRPHFQHVLERIEKDTIEINELSELVEQASDSVERIMSEAEAMAKKSHFQQEIRSLKHAILLLGMNRVHHILNERNDATLLILKTA